MLRDGRVIRFSEAGDSPASALAVYQADGVRGRAALACALESGVFSAQWAKVLAAAVMTDPLNPLDDAAFADWLRDRRRDWSEQVQRIGLSWFERFSLSRSREAASLLWVQVAPFAELPFSPAPLHLYALAVGDNCLLHYRAGRLLKAFPAPDFTEARGAAALLSRSDPSLDGSLRELWLQDVCVPDDLLILCTATIAQWALQLHDAGRAPAWESYEKMTPQELSAASVALRRAGQLGSGEGVFVLMRVSADPPRPTAGQERVRDSSTGTVWGRPSTDKSCRVSLFNTAIGGSAIR